MSDPVKSVENAASSAAGAVKAQVTSAASTVAAAAKSTVQAEASKKFTLTGRDIAIAAVIVLVAGAVLAYVL